MKKIIEVCCIILTYLLVFQDPLEEVHSIFKYIDEGTALLGLCYAGFGLIRYRKISDQWIKFSVCMCVFLLSGLLGNVIYGYQPIKVVLVDIFTNLKFFFAIALGYFIAENVLWERLNRLMNIHAKIITLMIFVLFVVDKIFTLYPSEVRYGINSTKLMWSHPTYFAGAMAFLLVLFMVFYKKNNLIYIIIVSSMMFFTLRSKAMASALIGLVIVCLMIKFKKKIQLKDVIVLGIGAVIIGWPLISFYYLSARTNSPRSIMQNTSFQMLLDYFPIGSGFGTFGSSMAAEYYSPVYYKYGYHLIEVVEKGSPYLSDTFWPIIFGQTGIFGTLAYLGALCVLVQKSFGLYKTNMKQAAACIFILVYCVISSTAEPILCNAISIPFAMVMGMVFGKKEISGYENIND